MMMDDYTRAEAVYEKADADYAEACRLLAVGRDGEARAALRAVIEQLGEVLTLLPYSAVAHYSRALALQKLGEYRRAVQDYTDALRINPADADARNNRGQAYAELGDFQSALLDFQEVWPRRAQRTLSPTITGRAS